jgi:two-component system, OmpR family, response regulator CpxR
MRTRPAGRLAGINLSLMREESKAVSGRSVASAPLQCGVSSSRRQPGRGEENRLGRRLANNPSNTQSRDASTPRLLIVDDDSDIREMLSDYLEAEGYCVESVGGGKDALERAAAVEYALIILDIVLPGMNGLDVLRQLRASFQIPVLMLTARGETIDRILGLQLGADDYLPKPFVPQELAARVQAILRRSKSGASESSSAIEVGDVSLDTKSRLVKRRGEVVDLTSVEFDLLRVLLSHAGQVVSREILQREVLGREYTPFDRSIDTHVCNLRKKLGATAEGIERIKSIRAAGYLFSRIPAKRP